MENTPSFPYVKRTQRDYPLRLKLKIVTQIERGELSTCQAQRQYGIQSRSTVTLWLRKYGSFDWENKTPSNMEKTPEQKIMELEAKVRLLEKQNRHLQHLSHQSDQKAILFDMMIELAEKEYNIAIRKNSLPGQSISTKQNKARR